jgi:hypothetical protein
MGVTFVSFAGCRHLLKRCLLFVPLVLPAPAGSADPGSAVPGKRHLEVRCVSLDRSSACGCGLKIVDQACVPPAHQGGGNVHFFSELHQGASLHLVIEGRELALPSLGPVDHSTFLRTEDDSWQETYEEGEGLRVRLSYRPGQSTCPPEKEGGCEYFDVEADVEITTKEEGSHRYHAVGACGC